MTVLSFLGPHGTFAHMATRTWADDTVESRPETDVPSVFAAVESKRVDLGVVPFDNSVEGYVLPSLDLLLGTDVVAVAECSVDITFDAFVRTGDSSTPTTATSHPHALAQCSQFIARRGLTSRAATSTAAACSDIAPGEVAIGPQICAELYDVERLEAGVEDFTGARTRFLLLAHRDAAVVRDRFPADGGSARALVAVTPLATGPGVLARVTSVFAAREINLSSLVTRPLKAQEGKYCFVFTVDGRPCDEPVRAALVQLLDAGDSLKVLGVYAAAGSDQGSSILSSGLPRGSVVADSDAASRSRALLWD